MAQAEEGRARAKAWAADINAARRRAGFLFPDGFAARLQQFREILGRWAVAEVAPGRLVPWLPVAFGAGIIIYFTAGHEPQWWATLSLALGGGAIAILSRRSALGFPLALALGLIAAGFATATVKTALIAHPVLTFPAAGVTVSGFVETREEREKSDRIVVRVHHLEGGRMPAAPERVRLAVRKGTAPAVGDFVELNARLTPPLSPLRPGGYDFARDMFFQRIGASGYALGAIKHVTPPVAPGIRLRYAAFVDNIREVIDKRIRTVVPGDRGAIASALITGKRDAITLPVNDAMYVSSLAHVLSISGYHMAVVAGIVFFFIRAGLALIPSLVGRRPIKKYAAAGAFVAAALYLLLSGAEVATQRSFIMIGIVLIGVMLDRPALTFRTLTVAAFGVLLLAPEAVVHPSFQMSFAATLALIAGYQLGLRWHANADSSLGARVALWGGREVAGLILASLVAGLATTPYAAFHFHRLAPYGVLANLLAMPVVSGWVMPMGILGVIALPFGFDAPFWQLMSYGLDWMIVVALWVANLPGAVGRIAAFGTGPLLLGTGALIVLCLLRTPLRWSGAVIGALACLWAVSTPKPDILVSAEGQAAAVRKADGRLAVLSSGRDTFAIKEWLAADGDARTVKDQTLHDGVACDPTGCIGKFADGRLVSMVLGVEAFEEDCARAAVVVSARTAPGGCAALLVDRDVWRSNGAIALHRLSEGFALTAARPASEERPWSKMPRVIQPPQSLVRPTPRDATPRNEDIDAGD
ncbi:MAG: ComEC/Rec2 family competence protein [Pseudolabrys sp.]